MTITAKILEDSITAHDVRLTTMELTYPRFFHAEFMTHRAFSRNAASSRAIPVKRMLERTLADPAFFSHVGKNKPGMQASEEVSPDIRKMFENEWMSLGKHVAEYVERWSETLGIHKQVANRALEPWQHITVIVTATEWKNFFKQRSHHAAMHEMRELSDKMLAAQNKSVPILRRSGEWHLPMVTEVERQTIDRSLLPAISTARCARVSYLNHDGKPTTVEQDIDLYVKLLTADPMHPSPFEHQALPAARPDDRSRNLVGWHQHRALIEMAVMIFPAHIFGKIADNQDLFRSIVYKEQKSWESKTD